MAPTDSQCFVAENGNEETISGDAVGIVATLFALHALVCKMESVALLEKYELLLDYAKCHAEARHIFKVID